MPKALDEDDPGVRATELLDGRSRRESFIAKIAHDVPELAVERELARGRFELRQVLGRGGMGVVFEAYDRARQQRVALKLLARTAFGSGLALKAEFRSLAEVEHANLVRLHELFCDEQPWFFTMELVEGVDFVRHVRGTDAPAASLDTAVAGSPLQASVAARASMLPDLERLRSALTALIRGILAIHAAGKLHCDLKPSNVLVRADGELKILDFGLVTDVEHASHARLVAGTPGFIAPERYAGEPASAASDFFAVGVILHEALTGSLPPLPETLRELTTKLSDAERAQVEPFTRVCSALLVRDPNERMNGEQVLAALGSERTLLASVPPAQFVGRSRELAAMRSFLHAQEAEAPCVLCVSGESGIGKSALLARFAAEARGSALTLHSRCYERESVRYKMLDGLIDQLAVHWSSLSPAEAAALIPRGVESLVQVFSVLAQVPAVRDTHTSENNAADPTERRQAAFRALRELLTRLADRQRVLLIIDDVQWGDSESTQEILNLLAPPNAPRVRLIASYRSTDVVESSSLAHFLRALHHSAVANDALLIQGLPEHEVHALASSLSDRPLSDTLLSQIVTQASGSPFFVGELVRQADDAFPVSAQDLVRTRIEQLGAEEQRLLSLIALAPGPIKQRLLSETAQLGTRFEGALQQLLANGLLRWRRGQAYDLIEPYHDRIREACLGALGDTRATDYHRAFVEALQRLGDAPLAVLAVHLEGCGESARAAQSYRRAAEQASEALAFELAAELYGKSVALQTSELTDPEPYLELARALAFAGHGPRSAAAYLDAAERAEGTQRDELRLRAAEQLLYAGHHARGLSLLESTLPQLGLSLPPRRRFWKLMRLAWNGLRVAFARERTGSDAALARRAAISDTLGEATLYLNFGLYVHFQQQHVLAALRAGEPQRLALALTSRALMTTSPFPRRFTRVLPDLERARKLVASSADPYVRGRIALNQAVVYGAVGRYAETAAYAREAERVFRSECHGMRWGLQHALAWRSVSMFYLGQLRQLGELCAENLPAAERRGDDMLSKLLGMWRAWVDLASGRVELALTRGPTLELDREFTVLDAGVLTQRGPLLLYVGRVEEAWELYRRCEPLVRAVGVMNATVRANEFHWTRGLCASHLLARGPNPQVERVLRKDVAALARSGVQDALAMAQHLEGNLSMVRGERELAAEQWSAAMRQYAACEMSSFAATLRYAVAQLGTRVDAAEQAQHAELALRDCGIVQPERWSALWCPRSEHSTSVE